MALPLLLALLQKLERLVQVVILKDKIGKKMPCVSRGMAVVFCSLQYGGIGSQKWLQGSIGPNSRVQGDLIVGYAYVPPRKSQVPLPYYVLSCINHLKYYSKALSFSEEVLLDSSFRPHYVRLLLLP